LNPRGARRAYEARVAALFFLSGASGLVFEVIWVKLLGLWTGQSTLAVSLVVAAFLLGLMLGSLAGGRLADRAREALRLYALLEAVTGLTALAVSLALARAGAWGEHLALSLGARVAVAFVLLLVPTAAMGATLPVLTRALAREGRGVGRSFATLYALNTLGAALGCALAGFVAIGAIGLLRTSLIAAAANLAVALGAYGLTSPPHPPSPCQERGEFEAHDATHDGADRTPPSPDRERGVRGVRSLAFVTGFVAIGCEVLWFRVLRSFVKSSTYSFTLMLVVYLAGLVCGGALHARRLASRERPWALFADVQSYLAVAVVLSVALLGRAANLGAFFAKLAGGFAGGDADAVHVLVAAAVIVLPTTLMGASLPVLASLAAEGARGDEVGRRVGSVTAANTLGGVAGSLVTGLALLPWLGAQRSFALAVAATLAVSLVAQQRASGKVSLTGDEGRTARIAVAVALVLALTPGDYLVRAVTRFPLARVLDVREGRDGTALVLGYTRETVCGASRACRERCPREFAYQQLVFGTVSYASTIPPARRYMRALAHLPMLQHSARASRVLEICFGTGTTAGAFTTHDALRALTLVDINRDVFGFARHFGESNLGVARDPRVRRVIEDGRHFLATTGERFDVISLEPPPPTAEGAATLYTREFYVLARKRLRPGGILAQWIPLDQQTGDLNRALLASALAEFAEVEVYIPSRVEAVVLASDRALTPDLARWRARWESPRVAENLADVGFTTPESLAATRVLDTRGARRWAANAAPMVDDLPAVEYYRSRPGEAFRVETMFLYAVPETPLARVERTGMRAWERSLTGDREGARALVASMRAETGPNVYVDYLGDLEYGCLDVSARPGE